MKTLIDIPNIPKNDHQRWVLTHGGIVLDGLTNGEVIQNIFPDTKVEVCNEDVDGNPHLYYVHGLDGITYFTADWWNRKWGE